MTYFSHPGIEPSPGLAYEAYKYDEHSPMFYHAPFKPQAAGPAFLSMDGVRSAWAAGPEVPSNLRGIGEDPTGLVSQFVEPELDRVVQGAIDRNWPTLEGKLNESLKSVKVILAGIAVVSGIAAAYSYMSYKKP
jgi:hypothetical protein